MENEGMNDSADSNSISSRYLDAVVRQPEQFDVNEALHLLPPLGLKLTRSRSLLEKIDQLEIDQARRHNNAHNTSDYDIVAMATPKPNDITLEYTNITRLKAENFLISSLKIGTWERISKHEGDLVGKCYFAKKRMVWEVLECGLKSKIEIQWSDISAFKATLEEDQPATLQIELNLPPLFYHEIDPQPRKHTQWRMVSDFTGGEATINRRHILKLPEGALDKALEKLFRQDKRLRQLSQQAFPDSNSPYFPPPTVADLSLDFGGELQISHQGQQQPLLSFGDLSTPYQIYRPPPHDSPISDYGSNQIPLLDNQGRTHYFGDDHSTANQTEGTIMPSNAAASSLQQVTLLDNYMPNPENELGGVASMQQQQEQQEQQQVSMLQTLNDEYQQNILLNNNSRTVLPNSMRTLGGNLLAGPNMVDNGAGMNNNNNSQTVLPNSMRTRGGNLLAGQNMVDNGAGMNNNSTYPQDELGELASKQQQQEQQQQPSMLQTFNDDYNQSILLSNNSRTVLPNSMRTQGGNLSAGMNMVDNGAGRNDNNNLSSIILDPQLYVEFLNIGTNNASFSSSVNNSDGQNHEGNYWL